jgi:hypothetical protein
MNNQVSVKVIAPVGMICWQISSGKNLINRSAAEMRGLEYRVCVGVILSKWGVK